MVSFKYIAASFQLKSNLLNLAWVFYHMCGEMKVCFDLSGILYTRGNVFISLSLNKIVLLIKIKQFYS